MASSVEMNKHEVKIKNQKGQVAVEYILLLVFGVGLWMVLVSNLVSRNPQTPGPIIRKWVQVLNFIGSDEIEKITPTN
jgi:uncharacterized membrane protein